MARPSAERLIKRLDIIAAERGEWESHWQDVADLVLPTRSFTMQHQPGQQKRKKIFNGTAPKANTSLASAVHGLLLNPSIRWFALRFIDAPELENDEEVQAINYENTSRMLAYFASARSGASVSAFEVCLDLCAFGTGVEQVVEQNGYMRFQARQLANFYMKEDDNGEIVEQFRVWDMPISDAVEKFGINNLSRETRRKLEQAKDECNDKLTIIHAVYKRSDRDPNRMNGPNMPWASVYLEKDQKHIIREGGFRENPFLAPRWSKAPEETYGRSPSMEALPDIMGVNAMSYTELVAGELAVRPPLNVVAGMTEGPIHLKPGALNYVKDGTQEYIKPMDLRMRPDIGRAMIEAVEARIEQFYFLDALKLPELDRMTAEEVVTRRMQGLLTASPVLSRLYAEWLDVRVARVYNWMKRNGYLLKMPDRAAGRAIRPEYGSPMALSQKVSEAQNFTQAITTAAPLANLDPQAFVRNVDTDAAIRKIFSMHNVDPSFLRSLRMVETMKRQEMEAAQNAQTLAELESAGRAGKDLTVAAKELIGGQS